MIEKELCLLIIFPFSLERNLTHILSFVLTHKPNALHLPSSPPHFGLKGIHQATIYNLLSHK